jgi:hypothetical protein
VLGPFRLVRGGEAVPAHAIASRKGRLLLKLLLARRGKLVPAATPADPDANLATVPDASASFSWR